MFFRTLLMMALVVSVSACSSKDKEATNEFSVAERTDVTGGPGYGTGADGMYNGTGPVPGSQQDLVVNVGDRVFFDTDQYTLTSEGQRTLDMQAEWLRKYPNVSVTIAGHADERGTREYNLALGERRANSIKSYLTALGIEGGRVSTISYGKERPAVTGSNPEAWGQNRRGVTEVN